MIVFEYVDNKNLQHWLHECPQQTPLSWSIRMSIIQGIAKGLEENPQFTLFKRRLIFICNF